MKKSDKSVEKQDEGRLRVMGQDRRGYVCILGIRKKCQGYVQLFRYINFKRNISRIANPGQKRFTGLAIVTVANLFGSG